MTKRSKRMRKLRGLRCEPLESRSLLAGDLGCSPWQNPDGADDVNADGAVSPIDALVTINAMNDGGTGALQGRFAPPALHGRFHNAIEHYVDPSGDSQLTPLDALLIINALNSKPTTTTTTTTTASLTDETTEETTVTKDGSTAEDTESTEETSTEDTSSDDTASTDDQPDQIGPDVPELTLQNGFARVRSAIDVAGDADVFRVVPTDTQLAVTLFAPRGAELQVSLVDASGDTIETVTTTGTGRHEHVTLDGAVEAGEAYYLVVTGAADTTANYCLGIMNYDPATFTPPTEGERPHGAGETHPASPTSTELFQKVDANSDGSITLDELEAQSRSPRMLAMLDQIFAEWDVDASGALDVAEVTAGLATKA